MKVAPLLLAGSLVANLALVALIGLRPSQTPAPAISTVSDAATLAREAQSAATAKDLADLRAALATGDAAALKAAGLPPEIVRALAIGHAFDTLQTKVRAMQPSRADGRYWRSVTRESVNNPSVSLERDKAQREFSQAVESAYGFNLDAIFSDRDTSRSYLSAAKRDELRRIEGDYLEMEQQISAEQSGVELPSDRQKLKMLRAEKERDIAAILTPEERQQLDLHESWTADAVRSGYGNAIQTDEDYRKIFALQKAFNDQFADFGANGPPSPDAIRARNDAQQKLQQEIRAAISPDAWAAAQRANDQDVRTADALARRLNLPATTTDAVLATRDTYAAQSMQINADAALAPADRRAQLAALATKAESDLRATLGAEGAQAFTQRAQWIRLLRNGQAFSTNPNDATAGNVNLSSAVYPQPLPGAARPPRG